jgi:hypothetical protein
LRLQDIQKQRYSFALEEKHMKHRGSFQPFFSEQKLIKRVSNTHVKENKCSHNRP